MIENHKLKNHSNNFYDIIIIGAGIGGLLTGNILQKKGYNVLICEKNNYPGGYFTSFKRKDFKFDVNLHWTTGCEEGGNVYNTLKQFGGEKCVEFIKLKEFYHWIDRKNNINFHISTSLPEYIQTLREIFPQDEVEINNFFNTYSKIFDPMVQKSVSDKLAEDIISPHFSNPNLKNIIQAALGFFGWPPNQISAFFMLLFSLSPFYQGAYYIKGGSSAFSNAITDILIDNGGVIKYEEEVFELKFQGEKLCGVIVMDKQNNNKTYYSHIIIANNNPLVLISNLTPEGNLPKDYIENIKKREPSLSAVNLYLGLDIDLKEYNISDYMIWTPINRDNSVDDLKMSLEMADYSKLPLGSITIYSNIDPTCCSDGKSVISVLCYAKLDPFERLLDSKDKSNMKYNSFKLKIKEQLIELTSKILNITDLKSHIEASELATPITFRYYSHNPNGSIMGWQMNPEQFVFKPLVQKTPIENLFLVGQWVSRTGGLPAVAGIAEVVSKLAIEYLEKRKESVY